MRTLPVAIAFLIALGFAGLMVYIGWHEVQAGIASSGRVEAAEPPPTSIEAPIIAGVLQTLIGPESGTTARLDTMRTRLESWGWVDESEGMVHIPIDKAISIVVEEVAR